MDDRLAEGVERFARKHIHADAELDVLFAKRIAYQAAHAETNHRELVQLTRARNLPLASHDDTTADHVAEAIRDGVALAEFPTTVEAAQALHAAGIRVLMGAPNLVRGGSHAGNIATQELACAGALDVLSSDYVPASLLHSAFLLREGFSLSMPEAIAPITSNPAALLGLADRGRIAVGLRADLVQVREIGATPTVVAVWRQGRRIA